MYDQKVPLQLRLTQEWFGQIISAPLHNDLIQPLTPRGRAIQEEALEKIAPSPTLEPYERVQIYNQQYWWRLLNILQDCYPLLTRLFGQADFNASIAVPFLLTHRPDHWSLNELGHRLPAWISKEYQAEDKALIEASASLDWAFHSRFFIQQMAPLSCDQIENKIALQPHVSLFSHPFDLFSFRQELLMQEANHWIEAPLPALKKGNFFTILFRTLRGNVAWKAIDKAEYSLLQYIEKGTTLDSACSWLEEQPEDIRLKAEEQLEKWFTEWSSKGILRHAKD